MPNNLKDVVLIRAQVNGSQNIMIIETISYPFLPQIRENYGANVFTLNSVQNHNRCRFCLFAISKVTRKTNGLETYIK